MRGRANERTNEQMNDQTSERANERTMERENQRTRERANKSSRAGERQTESIHNESTSATYATRHCCIPSSQQIIQTSHRCQRAEGQMANMADHT